MFSGRKLFLLIVGIGVGSFIGLGLILPETYTAEKAILISAEPSSVFPWINETKKHLEWSPWAASDETLDFRFGRQFAGEGAWYEWESDSSGRGRLILERIIENKSVAFRLDFNESREAKGLILLQPMGQDTRVVWSFTGQAPNLIGRYLGLMVNLLAGPLLNDGLIRLKMLAEGKRLIEPGKNL
ncbi:MAG: SRPBCC family protein [Myxococcota bacterium]|nr:SRPBCC family protein [Myxococcota bacterium]